MSKMAREEIAKGLHSDGSAYVPAEPAPVCQYCEGGGWECYGIGHHDPHFRECSVCHNPEGLPSP
jgi:hypothetical protein